MDNLMLRRRSILQKAKSEELYPIGTDIITKYIGRTGNQGNFNNGYIINSSGEYVTGSGAASPVYMPIDPNYRYQKTRIEEGTTAGRLINFAYYDADYNFISRIAYNNLNVVDLPAPPFNAKYARIQTTAVTNNWTIAIVRIS